QKVLFVGPEYKAIGTFDGMLSAWVNARAVNVDTGFKGVCILPKGLLSEVDTKLERAKMDRAELVETFIREYDSEREQARERLNGQFRESDYPAPDDVRAAFGLRWSYVSLGVADDLPPELAERERAKLESRFNQVADDVQNALRESLRDLVGHLSERLAPGADGKKKIFRDSAVGNLTEFLSLFSARNITNDSELAALSARAEKIIEGVSPEALRGRADLRGEVRQGLESVKAAVSALIDTRPARKFNLG
ncbi:MAG: hypothetical protein ACYSWO_28680, partial [Planctomycetota bacterium]